LQNALSRKWQRKIQTSTREGDVRGRRYNIRNYFTLFVVGISSQNDHASLYDNETESLPAAAMQFGRFLFLFLLARDIIIMVQIITYMALFRDFKPFSELADLIGTSKQAIIL